MKSVLGKIIIGTYQERKKEEKTDRLRVIVVLRLRKLVPRVQQAALSEKKVITLISCYIIAHNTYDTHPSSGQDASKKDFIFMHY